MRQAVIARAPVRVSFGGGGTDLAAYYERFGGFVVSAAIARYCYVVAGRSPDGGIGINSADYRTWERFPPGEAPSVVEPLSLPKAAVAWFAGQGLLSGTGVELFTASEVPPGSGLGSSSAMAVALVRALAAQTGLPMDATVAAELACWLEITRLDRPIGKQDQYASALGGINAIEFRAGGVGVTPLSLAPGVAAALADRLLLFSTGQTRDSAAILRGQRSATATDPAVAERLHRLKEMAWEMRDALVAGELDGFGALLDRGWHLKRGLGRRVSSDAIDRWYGAAREAGALGGKVAGAGGGGFLLLYCPPAAQPAVRDAMARHGLRELVFDIDWEGARVLVGTAENGALVAAGARTWDGGR